MKKAKLPAMEKIYLSGLQARAFSSSTSVPLIFFFGERTFEEIRPKMVESVVVGEYARYMSDGKHSLSMLNVHSAHCPDLGKGSIIYQFEPTLDLPVHLIRGDTILLTTVNTYDWIKGTWYRGLPAWQQMNAALDDPPETDGAPQDRQKLLRAINRVKLEVAMFYDSLVSPKWN